MPTNSQMEAADAREAARTKASLIRQGILEPVEGRATTKHAPKAVSRAWGDQDGGAGKAPDFHIPAARPIRLKSAKGETSFHFAHSAVTKVTYASGVDGSGNQPGAARKHGRYIERECAVATVDGQRGLELSPNGDLSSDTDLHTPSTPDAVHSENDQHPLPPKENADDIYPTSNSAERATDRTMVEAFALFEPDTGGLYREGSDEGADPHASLQLLSGRDLVCDGWGTEHFLQCPEALSMEAGESRDCLRCPPPGSSGNRSTKVADTEWESPLVRQDQYLIRPSALAVQPDDTRALLTNIDYDDDERANYWADVEKHERKPSPDKMEFRGDDHPDFWSHVLLQEDCPLEIRAKLTGPARNSSTPITIGNGGQVRAWLRKQPGYIEPRKGKKRSDSMAPPIAKFIDGRGGRVQYRIAAELPNELTPSQNFALLADFAKVFEERELPFVAVMHAPDQHNHEKNWHFHVAYHDRPARRINQGDIDRLASQGYDVGALQPGMWDFTVEVAVPGRKNRTTFPLRENKVPEVSRSREWPKTLRIALAKVVNQHLADASITRRVSPDTYEKMGIIADPQEHLATSQNALETKGVATPTGIENERKQWAAIQAQAEARYQTELAEAEAASVRAMLRQSSTNVQALELQRQLRDQLQQAALLNRDAFLLEQEMARAASRARMVLERNLQLIKAFDAEPTKADECNRKQWGELVGQASQYLSALDLKQTDDRARATRLRGTAWKRSIAARKIAQQLEQALVVTPPVQQTMPSSVSQVASSPAPAAARPAPSPAPAAAPAVAPRQPSVPVAAQPTPKSPPQNSDAPGFSPADIERRITEINARAKRDEGDALPHDPPAPARELPAAPEPNPKPPTRPQMPPPGMDWGR